MKLNVTLRVIALAALLFVGGIAVANLADYLSGVTPAGRTLTITQMNQDGWRQWIVLNDRVHVVDSRSSASASEGSRRTSVSLTPQARSEFVGAISAISPGIRGRAFLDLDVLDGVVLSLCFTPTGVRGSGDIILATAAVEELNPLIEMVSKLGPKDQRIDFVSTATVPRTNSDKAISLPLERYLYAGFAPRITWWSVWRTFGRARRTPPMPPKPRIQ